MSKPVGGAWLLANFWENARMQVKKPFVWPFMVGFFITGVVVPLAMNPTQEDFKNSPNQKYSKYFIKDTGAGEAEKGHSH
ncbi:hypothetical protein FVE85_6804 [Porphyridium purpureum]|uniref:Uncharacterized protein n=1 Tax=Porphyridium purpureum TaxID=35688 RepID=A0A5J4Z5A6_PORPP|nr:hypothetical protein FVE85_6804 [Porphyridium purpureum]|eukprot:POR5491..scf295_1